MFGICLLVFIGLCIYHASEKELPADYHRNWKLEQEDANKVRFGKMSQRDLVQSERITVRAVLYFVKLFFFDCSDYDTFLKNYAIRVSDDYLEPIYRKGDILLIQNAMNVKNNDTIFYVSDSDFYVKRCYVRENDNSSIFKHMHVNKNKLQTYGKIVYCIKNDL